MTTRAIPKTHAELIELGIIILGAADALADSIGLEQNTPARIRADLVAVTGPNALLSGLNTQSTLNEARASLATLRRLRRQAMADGRAFCAAAIDLLKIRFGRRWNVRWVQTGISGGSLAIPHDPLCLLIDLRNFFRAHPDQEVAALEITAARADSLATTLQDATQNVEAARCSRSYARRDRDEAVRRLATRLRGVRNELEQLLSRDDLRWRRFGFSRPIDRRQPSAVEEITIQPGLPGELYAEWTAAPRAENYRVTWVPQDGTAPAVEMGFIAETRLHLRDLPPGLPVIITITARNGAGESLPRSMMALAPAIQNQPSEPATPP